MDVDSLIVRYDAPLNSEEGAQDEVMQALHDEIMKVTDDEAQAAMLLIAISSALKGLDSAQTSIGAGHLVAPESQTAAIIQTTLAELAAEGAIDMGAATVAPSGANEIPFDHWDIVKWIGAVLVKLTSRKWPWSEGLSTAHNVGNQLRIALVADWGTAMYGAPKIAQTLGSQTFDIMMHLGDVYYSGTSIEVQDRFLKHWPKNQNTMHRALNSNHEMYSGGEGYFHLTLPAFVQEASYFALQNDHWVLAALDTGYEDHDLAGGQEAWLTNVIAAAGARRVLLFSHHQPFSALESQGKKLTARLASLLAARKVYAWYWGHEHRAVVYDEHPIWRMHGRCLGHGGMPYKTLSKYNAANSQYSQNGSKWVRVPGEGGVPGSMILNDSNPFIGNDYGPNGYMTLELDGPNLTERFHNPDGTSVYERTF